MADYDRTVVSTHSVDVRAIVAGAIVASAITGLLMAFGSALGLSLTSARAYGGLSATTLAILAALWFCAVNVIAFAGGGYIAGRLRLPLPESAHSATERRFRDGAHGVIVWALGSLIAAYLVASVASSGLSKAVDATASVASTAAKGVAETAGTAVLAYQADRLVRPGTVQPSSGPASDTTRQEVLRIVGRAVVSEGGLTADDRAYLVKVVAANSGLTEAEADKRVTEAFTAAKNARAKAEEAARDAAEVARKSALMAGLLTAIVSLLGLIAAVSASSAAGRDRDAGRELRIFGHEVW